MDKLAVELREILKERGLTQEKLATLLDTTQPIVSRSLKASVINERSHWPAILDALDLELVVRPKGQD